MHKDTVAVLMPTLHRPARMKENIENLYDVTKREDIDIIFVVEKDDEESLEMARTLDAITLINQRRRNFGGAINTAVRVLPHNYFFGGSDDFLFHPNWLPPLMELSHDYGMVGPEDLGNAQVRAGELAVSYLIRRDYVPRACIGYPEDLLYEGYIHNYTDTELTETARAQGEYKYCPDSIVEHMHPIWGKSAVDSTYELSLNQSDISADHFEFMSRRPLWQSLVR
jgi:GT2 family glycosyltransferase